ncbi:MAG: hypothetical protein ABEH88_02855 [Halobacteriales archaeon]
MAYRFVRAQPLRQRLSELRERLENGDIEQMEPFGQAMTKALQNARFDPETGEAVWIEEDYCKPPLAMERAEVLDEYFEDITVVDENVDEAAGWERIDDLPGLWNRMLGESEA